MEQLNEKVDELVLRPQVFSTRLEEQLERVRGEQQQLADSLGSLRDAVTQLAAAGTNRPVNGGSADKLQSARQTPVQAATGLLRDAAHSPGVWAAVGAFIGATITTAIILRTRHS